MSLNCLQTVALHCPQAKLRAVRLVTLCSAFCPGLISQTAFCTGFLAPTTLPSLLGLPVFMNTASVSLNCFCSASPPNLLIFQCPGQMFSTPSSHSFAIFCSQNLLPTLYFNEKLFPLSISTLKLSFFRQGYYLVIFEFPH